MHYQRSIDAETNDPGLDRHPVVRGRERSQGVLVCRIEGSVVGAMSAQELGGGRGIQPVAGHLVTIAQRARCTTLRRQAVDNFALWCASHLAATSGLRLWCAHRGDVFGAVRAHPAEMPNLPDLASTPASRWFPTEPALAVLDKMFVDTTTTDRAVQLGLDRRTVQRLATRSRLRSDAADRIAIALGRHPCEIWPEWFDRSTR
jgi:lambda repressor-like predicted transcriptional regulator